MTITLDAALSLFAADLMAENYDFAGYINRARVWQPTSQMPYPSTDTLYGEINRYLMKNRAVSEIGTMMFSLEGNNEYMQSLPVTYADRDLTLIISDMMNSCNIDDLSSFKFIRMDLSNPEAQLNEMNQENFTRSIQVYGADEQAEYTVLYSYNGETYAGGMTLIRYGNEWYIEFLSATLAGQPFMGYLTKMSESEYMERITSEELYSIYDRR